jgi:hypothetical protein
MTANRGNGMDPASYRAHRETPVDDLPLFSTPGRLGTTFDAARDRLRTMSFTARVLDLMLDLRWHTVEQLRAVGGQQGDRRVRLLRSLGFTVDCERDPESPPTSGRWRYRLAKPQPELIEHALQALSNARSTTKAVSDAEGQSRGAA